MQNYNKSACFQCRSLSSIVVILQTIYDWHFFIISLFMNSNSMFVLFCCLMLISIFQIKYNNNNPFLLWWPQLYKSSQVFCISSTQHCPFTDRAQPTLLYTWHYCPAVKGMKRKTKRTTDKLSWYLCSRPFDVCPYCNPSGQRRGHYGCVQ